MSAYGVISPRNRPTTPLPSTTWTTTGSREGHLTIHHLTLPTARALPGLLEYLHPCFAYEVTQGLTYPQETLSGETLSRDAFEAYFFAADVLVAIVGNAGHKSAVDGEEVATNIDDACDGRMWEACVAGFYYVKPNYPGRSSHICNAGFVVPPSKRGLGYGTVLARSYLHYGPRLGYHASVFNLVYVTNVASVRMWERLNFVKAGRIPRAGRLRRADGNGEEYVDAWVIYKSFAGDNEGEPLGLQS